MRKRLGIAYLAVILIFALMNVLPMHSRADALQTSGVLRIYGSVNRPLNLTYSELLSFPMVSEVATLECVGSFPKFNSDPTNWTGIPLFYLLTLAQINSDAYKVVTYGLDGFSSDLLVEDALRPTTILALEDNGTTSASEILSSPRLIVPNHWGYKWVNEVDAIEVVNYDYNGTYESKGYSDNGAIPGWTGLPSINPPLQELNITLGNSTFNVGAFTNVSINDFNFDYSQKKISLNVTVPSGGFADFILPQSFLKGPYNVSVDSQTVSTTETDLTSQSYLYVTFPNGLHNVEITGTEIVVPEFTPFLAALLFITATVLTVIACKRRKPT